MAFLFRVNLKHGTDGQTDGRCATHNVASYAALHRLPHNSTASCEEPHNSALFILFIASYA